MKTYLLPLAIFFSFLSSYTSNATHMIGGEITWECHPITGQYRLKAKLYKDCQGSAGLPNSQPIKLDDGGLNPIVYATMITQYQLNPSCYDPNSSINCGTGADGVDVGVYQSSWITISYIPPSGIIFSIASCCRTSAVTNLITPSYKIRAKMYQFNGIGAYNNSSPDFLEDHLARVCSGDLINFNPIASDPDNDSIFVKLATPLESSGATAVYNTGYSAMSPFPGTTQNNMNMPLSVDGSTGAMTFRSYTNGLFIGVYEIEEWRQGVLIGKVFRDAPTFIANCSTPIGLCPQSSNDAPTLDFIALGNSSSIDSASVLEFETTVTIGDTVRADIVALDININPNCSQQNITFSASGTQLSSDTAYGNPNLCGSNAPCATLTSKNSNGGFIQLGSNLVEFNWPITAAHVNYQGLIASNAKHVFHFKVFDDACPIPKFATTKLTVFIKDNIPVPPSLEYSCANIVATSGDISFNLTEPTDTADSFQGYYVYHATNKMGPYAIIDTLSSYSSGVYTDVGRGPGTNHYFMRTASVMLSPSSDTLSLMNLNIVLPSTAPATVTLNWNAHSSNQNTNVYYQIWKRISYSDPWMLVDSTKALTYVDIPSTVLAGLDYKIAIGGTCFSAKTNTIGIEEEVLDYVKVSPVPFNNDLTITVPSDMNLETLSFELYSVSGKKITVESEIVNSNELKLIRLKDLPHGVYILHLTANDKAKTFKLMH